MTQRNYSIKILSILLLIIVSVEADILSSKPSGAVNDFARILSPQVKTSLEMLSRNVYNKTGVTLALAAFPSLEGENIDDITNKLYERWGIGQKGKDEGVLVFLAMKERKIRIETGYGVEGYITDLLASQIRQQLNSFPEINMTKGLL